MAQVLSAEREVEKEETAIAVRAAEMMTTFDIHRVDVRSADPPNRKT